MSKLSVADAIDQRNLPALPDELLAVLSLENPLYAQPNGPMIPSRG